MRLKNMKSSCPITWVRLYKSVAGYHGFKPQYVIDHKPTLFTECRVEPCLKRLQLQRIVQVYREYGYQYANLDPLGLKNLNDINKSRVLSATLEGLLSTDTFNVEGIVSMKNSKEIELQYIQQYLQERYCGPLTFEVGHLNNQKEKDWLYKVAEDPTYYNITDGKKRDICSLLLQSQVLENFLAKKFPTLKRYSGEGAESMLSYFYELFSSSANAKVEDLLISIPHRGRTSLLIGMLNYPAPLLFSKIKGNPEFAEELNFIGDVISHLTSSTDLHYGNNSLHVTMVPNPSHLEASHPVVFGKTRSRQLTKGYGHYGKMDNINKVINIQVHGDAAICAQGIVMETLSMVSLPHFDVGGSIHLIVNNQLGFTTPPDRATASMHCSDVGKVSACPIIHVNGDHPEQVAKSAKIALDYKNLFQKDIIINMHCFRRWGHNELDDPTFTNPSMYRIIETRPSVPDLYKSKLIEANIFCEKEVKQLEVDYLNFLNGEFTKIDTFIPGWEPFKEKWKGIIQADNKCVSNWDTGCSTDLLKFVGSKSVEIPEHMQIHPHLQKTFCQARLSKLNNGVNIDWATAEALAIGSLLLEGNHVRICGQDVGRGTFNHRHAMLVHQQTDDIYVPLNSLIPEQKGFLEVVNSPLSEEAVLAYEYGMSIENPNHLLIWEAQFGDFFNGAQIIIDTFVSNGELKWLLQSGLVMLLPHGIDGAGPDHSSCKIERFLQLSDSKEDSVDGDDVNMQIVNPTTPAQYFHLLRRQQVRNFRKPLIVASPKLILRMSAATSSLSEMKGGTYFKPVISDEEASSTVETVVFCSGKHFYELAKQRKRLSKNNMAIIRIESLVPFPAEELKEEIRKYTHAKEFIWSQEEHRNQGPWTFIYPRFLNLLNIKLSYCGRAVLGASSVGVGKWYNQETENLVMELFGHN